MAVRVGGAHTLAVAADGDGSLDHPGFPGPRIDLRPVWAQEAEQPTDRHRRLTGITG
jgi:hypothetical protein